MNTEVMFSSKKMTGQHRRNSMTSWIQSSTSPSTLVQMSPIINATSILRSRKMDLNSAGGGRPYFAIRHTVERLKTG